MIVCNCRGASDRDVKSAIQAGAECLSELEQRGIGGDCRCCEDMLREMIIDCAANPCPGCVRRPLAVAG
jgi:bacterioferritin-associated ferredoxin